jgi:phospholipid/cholesterol/gamma-HCH transport system substrate-binding protein
VTGRVRGLVGRRPRLTAAVAVLVVALAVVAVVSAVRTGEKTVTAYFTETPGLHEGDQVRVMGVPVGVVGTITPLPDQVRVDMTYDGDRTLPADVQAVLMTPSILASRYVQLTPPTAGRGPGLPDGATIPRDRTAVPVEWDEVKSRLTSLAGQLGPGGGADPRGALNGLLDVGAANLAGRGATVRDTLRQVSRTVTTLSDGREDLVATVRNLQAVTATLRAGDAAVDRFGGHLAQASDLLAGNRADLARTLDTLDRVTPLVTRFVAEHRTALADRTAELARISGTLADNRQEIANVLQKAPTVAANGIRAYDQESGAFLGAVPQLNTGNPTQLFCSTIFGVAGDTDTTTPAGAAALQTCRQATAPLVDILRMNNLPLTLDPLPQQPAGGPR